MRSTNICVLKLVYKTLSPSGLKLLRSYESSSNQLLDHTHTHTHTHTTGTTTTTTNLTTTNHSPLASKLTRVRNASSSASATQTSVRLTDQRFIFLTDHNHGLADVVVHETTARVRVAIRHEPEVPGVAVTVT
jgi:hypothetical protein